jgi:quercetin dioxygenase-like cupin family protein
MSAAIIRHRHGRRQRQRCPLRSENGRIAAASRNVHETIVSIVEFGPGISAPWHLHPSAQEMLYALDGNLFVEIEGRGSSEVKLGEASVIPADIPHSARNDSKSATARALVVHSRAAKDKPFVVPVKR